MSRHGDPLPIRFYRRALAMLPRHFRRDRGPAMVAMLADEWRETRVMKRVTLLARYLLDLLCTAIVERIDRSGSRRERSAGTVPAGRDERVGSRPPRWSGSRPEEGESIITDLRRFRPRMSWLDVKLGLRMLVKHPILTTAAVCALSIGIPLGLLPMHVSDAMMAPLPVDDGDRIKVVRYFDTATSDHERPTPRDFVQWREDLGTFEALGLVTRKGYNVRFESGGIAPVEGAEVTSSAFDVLRVPAVRGRSLNRGDEVVGAPDVVVISYDLWQSRLDGDPQVVGSTLRIGGAPHTVVGVMPEGFLFPFRSQVWLPRRVDVRDDEAEAGYTIFGRLAEGVPPERAEAEIATLRRPEPDGSRPTDAPVVPQVVSFATGLLGFPRGGLGAVQGFFLLPILSILVLTVACANTATLVLARTKTRASELAMRTALGASRTRILSQLFTEALVMALLAVGAGLVAVDVLVARFRPTIESYMPYWVDFGISPSTVSWAFVLAVFSAAVVGVVPAVKATGRAVQRNIQQAASSGSGGHLGGLSTALIIVDVALAVAMLGMVVAVSSGLRTARAEVSFPADQYLAADLVIPMSEGADAVEEDVTDRVREMHREAVRRLRAEPGVRGVAAGSRLPHMNHRDTRIELEGEDRPADFRGHDVKSARVGVGFFEAFHQPILRGRGFNLADLGGSRSAVIVNTTFVDRVLRGESAVGRRIRYVRRGSSEPGPWYEIVGVVGDLGMDYVKPSEDQGLYHPAGPGEIHPVRLAVHVGADPLSFTSRLRAMVNDIDATARVSNARPLDEVRSEDAVYMVGMRLGAGIVSAILLALAASAIYALMSFSVAERAREIGIRRALGAQRSRLALAIARRSLAQLGGGILVGMPLAGLVMGALQRDMGWDPGFSSIFVASLLGVGVMVVIGSCACTVPLARALRIMPTEALREE